MKRTFLFILSFLFVLGMQSQTITFNSSISASENDAEEEEGGASVSLTSSDLEMVNDGSNGDQTVGVRFANVSIPVDAIIDSAYIQFTADGDYNEPTSLVIKGEYAENSASFEGGANNISSRATTTSAVNWDNIVAWYDLEAGANQQTPDLTSIVEEIITSNNWQEGNAITFVITGTGKRKAFSYDGSASFAAELVIVYSPANPIYDDLGISNIINPEEIILANSEAEVEISIFNIGLNSQSGFSVSYTIDGGTAVTETVNPTISTGETLNYTFSQTADLSLPGDYNIEVEVVLAGDENLANNTLSKSVNVIVANDSLFFSQGSTWKYLDDGSDQGTAWQELSFDDSGWSVGQGHMGFGEGDEGTVLASGYITYYFRKKVNIPDLSALDSIYFNIVHDDGAVAYVNGVEVLRSDLMPDGPIDYLTPTTTFIPNDVENDFWTYHIDNSYFQQGENIIAIEIHNQSAGSSDISFDCYVSDTVVVSYELDGPYVFYRNNEIVVKYVETSGAQTYTYQNPEDANLVCRFPNGVDSFMVELRPELEIEPSLYELPEKFYAISDLEGNLEAFVMFLKDAGIMDEEYNWIFGNGHLFFVGDMFDRGENVTECLWLLYHLESQAIEQNGRIHFIMGNHDIMNLIYDFRYVAQKYIDNVELIDETLESLYATDSELGRWLRTKNIIEKAGPFIFVHGGLSPAVNSRDLTYDEINYWGRYRMDSVCQTDDCSVVNGGTDYGIYWYRGMSREELTQEQVNTIVEDFEGEMVVVGHTIFNSITLLYQGRVIGIDLEHTDNYTAGFMEAMYYENGEIFEFHTDGAAQTYTFLSEILSINELDRGNNNWDVKICPNPMNEKALLRYSVPYMENGNATQEHTLIRICNSFGVLIETLVDTQQKSGKYESVIDVSNLGAGMYYCQISIGGETDVYKLIIAK